MGGRSCFPIGHEVLDPMPDLPPGIYEQLVTVDLQRRLSRLDPALVDRGMLEPGYAHEVPARRFGRLARRTPSKQR